MRSVFDTWFIDNVKSFRSGHIIGPLTDYDKAFPYPEIPFKKSFEDIGINRNCQGNN